MANRAWYIIKMELINGNIFNWLVTFFGPVSFYLKIN